MQLRAIARHLAPYEARLRYKLWRRSAGDRRLQVRFAPRPESLSDGSPASNPTQSFENRICRYERRIIDYDGQTQFAAAKRHNLTLLASQLNGVVVAPGETFSVWQLAGRPSEAGGYMRAAGLRNRKLVGDVGGSTCLMSTVLYNVALLGAMDVTERHCHSVDVYGEQRYFELGRDAAIEYGYLDLRFRNPLDFPVQLTVSVGEDCVWGELLSQRAHGFDVEIEVSSPSVIAPPLRSVRDRRLTGERPHVLEAGMPGLQVAARRLVHHADGGVTAEQLPGSLHHPIPTVVASRRPVPAGRVHV